MIAQLAYRRRAIPVYPGEDIQGSGRLRLEGVRHHAIETGRVRLIVISAVFLIAFAVVGLRMIDLTMFSAADGPPTVRQDQGHGAVVRRADIVDRNGILLATSLPTAALYASPQRILDPEEAATALVKVLPELSRSEILSRLTQARGFVYLRRNLTPRQQQRVNDLGIPGLAFEYAERRVYPQGMLSAHVVGLTDLDSQGVSGIEKTFDAELRNGRHALRLALDVRVQAILRSELERAVGEFKAIGASGIVMHVHTGEVIAMVSLPDFDPNRPPAATSEEVFNRATLGVYEMGSTFKLFTTAMALDTGTVSLANGYDASQPIRVARFSISDYHAKNRWLSVPEILVYSSNIGAAKMALDVGTEAQRAYLGRLGLLRAAAVELPEVGSPLVPSPWREVNTMTISYGHGLAVTPLQTAGAIAALVNGGRLPQPTLLRHEAGEPIPAPQVLKPQTSKTMRDLMRLVVENGTGSKADAPGYHVGGKTGTAEKLGLAGKYRRKALLSSFVGAFPIDDPQYVVLAMIDEPRGNRQTLGFATGGWTAAPVVSRVVSRIGPLLGIKPRHAPPVLDPAIRMARDTLIKGAKLASAE